MLSFGVISLLLDFFGNKKKCENFFNECLVCAGNSFENEDGKLTSESHHSCPEGKENQ